MTVRLNAHSGVNEVTRDSRSFVIIRGVNNVSEVYWFNSLNNEAD